jgi:hypothetical protein
LFLIILYQQLIKPVGVQREPYDGKVVDISNGNAAAPEPARPQNIITNDNDFHARPKTASGARNMQDSTFSFSGEVSFCTKFHHHALYLNFRATN